MKLFKEREIEIVCDLTTSGVHYWRGIDQELVNQLADLLTEILCVRITTHPDHLEIHLAPEKRCWAAAHHFVPSAHN